MKFMDPVSLLSAILTAFSQYKLNHADYKLSIMIITLWPKTYTKLALHLKSDN